MFGYKCRKSFIWTTSGLFGYRDSEFSLCLAVGIANTLFGYPILYLDSSVLFGIMNSKFKKKKKVRGAAHRI